MKMNKWTSYDKYIVMTDSVVGVRHTYPGFIAFGRVKKALTQISKGGSGVYLYDGNAYKRPITQSRAVQILGKIEMCKWDDDIRTVAKQIGAREMLSPRR